MWSISRRSFSLFTARYAPCPALARGTPPRPASQQPYLVLSASLTSYIHTGPIHPGQSVAQPIDRAYRRLEAGTLQPGSLAAWPRIRLYVRASLEIYDVNEVTRLNLREPHATTFSFCSRHDNDIMTRDY